MKFGDRVRNLHASKNNPHRDGFYVETIVRTGVLNKGTFARITDGKGSFWSVPISAVAEVSDELA